VTCTKPLRISLRKKGSKWLGVSNPEEFYYTENKLTGYAYIEVPCGKCMACRIQRVNEWVTRLMHEYEQTKKGMFINLTYKNEELKYGAAVNRRVYPIESGVLSAVVPPWISRMDNHGVRFATLDKTDLQRFFKRFRKEIQTPIKYFACGEYGEQSHRPHYHIILLGYEVPLHDLYYDPILKGMTSKTIQKLWTAGHNVVGAVERDSIQYTVGYITKKLYGDQAEELFDNTNRQRPFQLQSQGIGLEYAKKNIKKLVQGELTTDGITEILPRYYKKKLVKKDLKELYNDRAIEKIYQQSEKAIANNLDFDQLTTRDRQIREAENVGRANLYKSRKKL